MFSAWGPGCHPCNFYIVRIGIFSQNLGAQPNLGAPGCWAPVKVHPCAMQCSLQNNEQLLLRIHMSTVNFLNIWTPKTFVVITLKVEQDGVSLE